MPLSPGVTLSDVVLTRRLGGGGQGEVWAGRRSGGPEIAVKVLEASDDAHAVLRAMREARLQGQIRHPNIVRIHDFQMIDGLAVIFSELVDGISLRQLLRKGRPTLAQLDRIALQLFDGVEAAHAQGLVHRDLKPGNVLLAWEEQGYVAKITDFGIAVEPTPFGPGDDLAGRGQAVGTAGFMAPEQHLGRELVDGRADLFGLGAVLYWMATGRRAFSGSSWLEVVERSCQGRFTPVPVVAPQLHEHWASTIHWALDPSPRRRPADVGTMRRAWLGAVRFPDWVGIGPDELRPDLTVSDQVTEVHDLPDQTDASIAVSFGRRAEIEALDVLLNDSRLVTLRGAPGIGKTHLATLIAAHRLTSGWGWVQCYLTEARSHEGLLVALSAGLALPFGGEAPQEQLARAIGGRGHTVFVLDNAEQVAGPLAALLPDLLEAAPKARFVVTSRRALQVPGEAIFDVGPLDAGSATSLFQDRARRRKPNLQFTKGERVRIAELATLLEGNPLALELAAARAVEEDSLAALIDTLRDGRRAPDRAMQSALQWSWRLLAPWERHVLGCCAVFSGGFSVPALEAMLDLAPWPMAPDALAIVHGLVDHSLIALRGRGRLQVYESVRAFVLSTLHPNERASAEQAHVVWFARLGGEEGMAVRKGPAGEEATRELLLDGENVSRALDLAIAYKLPALAVDCASAMGEVLVRAGPPVAGVAKVEAALALRGHDGEGRARLYLTLGHLLRDSNQHARAVSALQTALALGEEAGATLVQAEALTRLGMLAHHRGQPIESEANFERALAILPDDAPAWRVALIHRQLCAVHQHMGAFEAAEASIQEALALLAASGNVTDVPLCHIHLGSLRAHQGHPDEATVYEQLALSASKRMGDVVQEGRVLANLGVRLHQLGKHSQAVEAFERAAVIAVRTGSLGHEAIARGNLGETLLHAGRLEEAGAELTRAVALGDQTWPVVAGTFRTTLARLLARQERYDEATAMLDEAEPMLRAVHRTNHAALQLARAEISARRGEREQVQVWIDSAERVYGGDDLAHDPELALRMIEVLALMDKA